MKTDVIDTSVIASNQNATAVTISGMTTVTDGANVFAVIISADDNTHTPSGTGWGDWGGGNIGSLYSSRFARNVVAVAGAVPALTFTQLNGPDTAYYAMVAFRPLLP